MIGSTEIEIEIEGESINKVVAVNIICDQPLTFGKYLVILAIIIYNTSLYLRFILASVSIIYRNKRNMINNAYLFNIKLNSRMDSNIRYKLIFM
jgi:hypothetical protein